MTEEKNSKSESKEKQPKNERQFNQEQEDRLIECSEKGPEGIKEWNKWRKGDPSESEQIWLQGANLHRAKLQGADLHFAKLQGAKFIGAIVNGSTNFLGCEIDENTDFRETALENTRIESGTKTCLEYNIRRKNWQDWYKEHLFLQWPVKLFFSISNYGISTSRIIHHFRDSGNKSYGCIHCRWPWGGIYTEGQKNKRIISEIERR